MVNFDLVADAADFVNAADNLHYNNEVLPEVEETPWLDFVIVVNLAKTPNCGGSV